jgi:hypothetical protein
MFEVDIRRENQSTDQLEKYEAGNFQERGAVQFPCSSQQLSKSLDSSYDFVLVHEL